MEIYNFLVKKIDNNIVINDLLPYTYNTQPAALLNDIRSFKNDLTLVWDHYMCQNYHTNAIRSNNLKSYLFFLSHDLYNFCIITTASNIKLMSYVISIGNEVGGFCRTDLTLYNHKKINHSNTNDFYTRYIRLLWGILTPMERTKFINEYILDMLE